MSCVNLQQHKWSDNRTGLKQIPSLPRPLEVKMKGNASNVHFNHLLIVKWCACKTAVSEAGRGHKKLEQ